MRFDWLMESDELGILADTGWMTPDEAREVAQALFEAAHASDGRWPIAIKVSHGEGITIKVDHEQG